MKKLTLSLAAIAAMGTFAVAGGDIAPVEPVVDTPVVAPLSDAGFYIGGAYGYGKLDISDSTYSHSENFNSFMLQGGYKINPYIAVEGRYWFVSSDDWADGSTPTDSFDTDSWGIYIKPMYPVTDAFDVYALLGYGDTDPKVGDWTPKGNTDGFQWGLGASYDINSNFAVFVDYVNLYDGTNDGVDIKIDTWNFGVTYKF